MRRCSASALALIALSAASSAAALPADQKRQSACMGRASPNEAAAPRPPGSVVLRGSLPALPKPKGRPLPERTEGYPQAMRAGVGNGQDKTGRGWREGERGSNGGRPKGRNRDAQGLRRRGAGPFSHVLRPLPGRGPQRRRETRGRSSVHKPRPYVLLELRLGLGLDAAPATCKQLRLPLLVVSFLAHLAEL